MRDLPRPLSDGGDRRPVHDSHPVLYLLPDDRAARRDPARIAAAAGGLGLWLRRLPGGLPVHGRGGERTGCGVSPPEYRERLPLAAGSVGNVSTVLSRSVSRYGG